MKPMHLTPARFLVAWSMNLVTWQIISVDVNLVIYICLVDLIIGQVSLDIVLFVI